MRGSIAILSMVAIALALLILPTVDSSPEATEEDADFIVADVDGFTTVMTKVEDESGIHWETKSYQRNTDVTLSPLSKADDDIVVLIHGAYVAHLTLFEIDTVDSLVSSKNLTLKISDCNIDEICLLSVAPSIEPYLGKQYDLLSMPLGNVSVSISSGIIDCFIPTKDMVAINDFEIETYSGLTINRLYATGSNGKYNSVKVSVNGSNIGYIANLSSKISSIEYRLSSGSVDYFCIGSDTQNLNDNSLSSMKTSFVTGDVSVYIGKNANVSNCILGGGILTTPSLLCNGESIKDTIAHSVTIDAVDTDISTDVAFLNDNRTKAYHLDKYVFGGITTLKDLVLFCEYDVAKIPLYDADGIWKSFSSVEVLSGTSLFLDSRMTILSGESFSVDQGGSVTNAGLIFAKGDIDAEGKMTNNKYIVKWPDSTISGNMSGIGCIADYFHLEEATLKIDVSTSFGALYIDNSSMFEIESVKIGFTEKKSTAYLLSRSVFICSEILVSMSDVESPAEFDIAFKVDAYGIDDIQLSNSDLLVSVTTDPNRCAVACIYDDSSHEYSIIEKVEHKTLIMVKAKLGNHYYFQFYDSDPHLPKKDTTISTFDIAMIIITISVFVIAVLSILMMKR